MQTKNITGRLLVGLRWWNEANDTGSAWRFETLVEVSWPPSHSGANGSYQESDLRGLPSVLPAHSHRRARASKPAKRCHAYVRMRGAKIDTATVPPGPGQDAACALVQGRLHGCLAFYA